MTRTGDHGRGRHKPTKAPKPTRAEQELRITEIYKLLLMRVSRHDILRHVAEKTTWGIKERTIEYLISKANARFEAHAKTIRDLELGKAIAGLSDLYSRAHRVQDYKTCLAAQRELNELLGLYAPKRLEHTGPEGGPQSFIALIPASPSSREEWTRQCQQELTERETQSFRGENHGNAHKD